MAQATRILLIAILGMTFVSRASYAAEVDRAAVDFKTPSEIKWVRNAAGTNESAVSVRRPEQAGAVRGAAQVVAWQHEPAALPSQRPFLCRVVRHFGGWAPAKKFDPDNTVPMTAGSYVIHYGGKVHYDGAKNEEAVIQVWGMGPATSTPAEKR